MLRRSLNVLAAPTNSLRSFALRKGLLVCCVAWLLVSLAQRANAQATGQITGAVTDPAGRVVAGAAVELVSTATAQVRATTSAADGVYAFPLVNPGTYQVRVSQSGFKSNLIDGVQVEVNGTTRADARLVVGSASEQVTVSDAAPLVETSNASMGIVVAHQSIVDLPLNGRNFAQLGTLIPGVVGAPTGLASGGGGNATVGGFGDATGSFNVNGQRNQSNNFLLDGAPNNDSFNSGFVMRPPPDAIEEFKIITHSYEAQYGRNSGSVVNVVTRSGTNAIHGSVWEYNREAALAAKTYFAAAKPNYQQNQFGAAAQAPILKDKLFIAGYYEGLRVKDATSNVLNVLVPGAVERGGNFSELLPAGATCASVTASTPGVLIDPLTGAPACYNNTPNAFNPARISAVSAKILSTYVPSLGTAQGFYKAAPANIDNRDQYGFRADWKIGKHAILGRYLRAHQNLFSPISPSNFAPTGNRQIITTQDGMGSHTWTISDHTINVARFSKQHIDGTPNATSGLDLGTLGYAYTATSTTAKGLPNITIAGAFSQGDAQQPFAYRANDVLTGTDDFTWTKSRHLFQFGGQLERDRINLLYINRPNGNFTFTTFFTGNGLSDFLLGLPQTFQQGSGDPALNGSSWTYAGYAQDQFRVSKRVTLEYGLRYEINRPYVEDKNHLAALHPGQQSTTQPNAPVGLVYPGDANTPRSTYNTDTNNVAPRLGLIVDPLGDGKTSLRAAWGLFYDTTPGQGDFFQNGTLAPPFQPLQEIDFNTRPKTAATSTYLSNPYSGVAAGPVGFPPSLTFIGWGLPDSFKTAIVQQYNLSIQHQLARSMGFELAYVGSRGNNLPIFIEVNPTTVTATGATTAGANAYRAGTRAVFSALGLARPTFAAGKSWYDSMQASWQLRDYHHLHATAAYTWGHSFDNASGLNIGADSRPVLPVTIGNQASIDASVAREKGPSLFDARNRFVMSLQYEFPKLDNRALLERLLVGGWNFNTIYQVQSGSPYSVVNSTTTAQSLTFRPNMTCNPNVGGGHVPGTLSTQHYINTSCFALPTVSAANGVALVDNSQSGNESRNVVLGPGFNTTDLSLFKSLNFTERTKFEFRFEVFNAFNEAHFAQPVATFGTSTFGQITSTIGNDSRVIQMAVKASF